MGVREIRYCDLTGTEDGVESHEIHLDQMRIAIDLAAGEYQKLLTLLGPYMDAGRIDASVPDGSALGGARRNEPRRRTTSGLTAEQRQELRQWAEENGIEVPSNNRFSQALVQRWREAHEEPAPASQE